MILEKNNLPMAEVLSKRHEPTEENDDADEAVIAQEFEGATEGDSVKKKKIATVKNTKLRNKGTVKAT